MTLILSLQLDLPSLSSQAEQAELRRHCERLQRSIEDTIKHGTPLPRISAKNLTQEEMLSLSYDLYAIVPKASPFIPPALGVI